MPEAAEKRNRKGSGRARTVAAADMAPLVRRVRTFLAEREDGVTSHDQPMDPQTLSKMFGFTGRGKGRPQIVLAGDTAIELGHPRTASQSMVLMTFQPELVSHNRISIVGPDFEDMREGGQHAFAQVVMLAIRSDRLPDPFDADSAQYLTNRLAGFMVRSVPGRLWVRISRQGRAEGLTLKTIGSALIAAYGGDFKGVEGVEVVFVTSGRDDVEALAQVGVEASILAGKHKKLFLAVDGGIECSELDCDSCDSKQVCDNLRDIAIKRRRLSP